jgi:cell division septation protein DedD
VQIGSFSDQDNARTILSLLQNAGYHGDSTPFDAKGKTLYRVRLGPFANEAAARQAQDKVAHQGYPQARALSEAAKP